MSNFFVVISLYPLNQKWFWQLFFVLLLAILVPFVIFYIVLALSPSSIILVLIVAVFIWVIFRGYRSWVDSGESERSVESQANAEISE